MKSLQNLLEIHPDVKRALDQKGAVVALESTIISHGMPFPQNLETALILEEEVRKRVAVPATIALIKGKIKVGLTFDELQSLAKEGPNVHKTSKRDLAFVLSKKITGATTVAATMIIAEMAGIEVFATGGIGGVHRGASKTFDISADLQELAKTNVAVICAGVKSILDIGLTLEYLETMGVPVIGYKTDEMPAFFSSKSGFKLDFSFDTPNEIAEYLKIKKQIGLKNGVLIAQPVLVDFDINKGLIDEAIAKAISQMKEQNIKGKETTPFLLAKVNELTHGKSLESNIELVKSNVKLATEIALCLAKH